MSIVLSSFRARIQAYERSLAEEAITAAHGSLTSAARLCGIHKFQMLRIIDRHGLRQRLTRHAPRGGNDAWRELGEA